jgi:HD superfamily phosphohydrolase
MNKRKIINDPVYGFITIPYDIIFDLMEHPWFQRLRRIKQLALTHYVYPGALHTRFHHALGALHLTGQAIDILRSKGTLITEEEAKAVSIAIFLHDIGHGPFSHALEHILVNIHHEDISVLFMERLNKEFDGQLDLAIRIFNNDYPKKFLYQLISGQLDMDRMDYLSRDSFFTGVSEGVIGYHRIINMLAVKDNELTVEEKGLYSIERFLTARKLMYWQVYLHKTTLVAEQMLIKALERAKELARTKGFRTPSDSLNFFINNDFKSSDLYEKGDEIIQHYAALDDTDIVIALKMFSQSDDFLLSFLSKGLLYRKLFRIEISDKPFKSDYINNVRHNVVADIKGKNVNPSDLILMGKGSNTTYSTQKNEIKILKKNGKVVQMSKLGVLNMSQEIITKYYLCYPKSKS